MSLFLGASQGLSVLSANDDRLVVITLSAMLARAQAAPWAPGVLWPPTQGLGGQCGLGGPFMNQDDCSGDFEAWAAEASGGQQQRKIVGFTKDSIGAPLGSVIVQGFVTATETFIGQVTSDSSGWYELPTPYAGVAHYLVAYKTGGTDVAGTTVNTIIPT